MYYLYEGLFLFVITEKMALLPFELSCTIVAARDNTSNGDSMLMPVRDVYISGQLQFIITNTAISTQHTHTFTDLGGCTATRSCSTGGVGDLCEY